MSEIRYSSYSTVCECADANLSFTQLCFLFVAVGDIEQLLNLTLSPVSVVYVCARVQGLTVSLIRSLMMV